MFARRCAALAALSVLILTGCDNQQPTQSGFLSDYRSLCPANTVSRALDQKPDAATLSRFTSVYAEPVVVRSPPDIAPPDGRELAGLTEKALKAELARQWTIAGAPGPQTIWVRTALTAVRKSNPVVNVALTAVAAPLVNGGPGAEGELLAGVPPRRIGAIAWADEGRLNPLGHCAELEPPRELTVDFARAVAAELDRSATRS